MSPEDLLADLPPVRDDEPSSLRQDIADELADHLECAVRREQVKSNEAEDVKRRVLERFGDPRQIAHRLWWLAMWSRIMSQRVLLGVSLTGNIVAVLLSVVVFWQFGRENGLLRREQAALTQQLVDQRVELTTQLAVMATRLDQLQNRPAPAPALPPGEPTLKVRLEGPEPGSPPPPFAQVSIKGLQLRNQALERTNGVRLDRPEVDFGKVVSGGYRIQVAVGPYKHSEDVALSDGDVGELVIRCPSLGPDVGTKLAPALPEDLQERGIVAYAEYELLPVEVAGNTWERFLPGVARSRDYNEDRGPFLTLLAIEPPAGDRSNQRMARVAWSERENSPFNPIDPFAAAIVSVASGEAMIGARSENTTSGLRVRLTRLVLVDDIYPLRDEQRQLNRGFGGGGEGPLSRWSPIILVFDGDRLPQFPSLVEPVVLSDEPIRLTLPPELLTVIRTALVRADAADAAVPANFMRSSSFRRDEIRSLLEFRRKVLRP